MRRWSSTAAVVALLVGLFVIVPGAPAGAAAPTNDAFAAATDLGSSATGTTTGTNLDATREEGEPGGGEATVWWSWTAPASDTYMFDTCGSDFTVGIEVYTGTSLALLGAPDDVEHFTCFYGGGNYSLDMVAFTAVVGTEYLFQVYDWSGDEAMGDIALSWYRKSGGPANDAYAAAETISGVTGSVTGSNRFATPDSGQPGDMGSFDSVWYRWQAPASGIYAFDTCGTWMDTRFWVFTGEALGALETVASGSDDCGYQAQGMLAATADTWYTIAVTGHNATYAGDFVLRWLPEAVPANDDLAAALPISGANGTSASDNRFATGELGEPYGSRSVWWEWTAPATGNVVFDACLSNTSTGVQVYGEAADVASLVPVSMVEGDCVGPYGLSTIVVFQAVEGSLYEVQVGSSGVGGDVVLRWRTGAPPANDDVADAVLLEGAGGTVTASNLYATEETGEPVLGGHSIWWRWTAPGSEPVRFDTCGSKIQGARVSVFTGTAVGSLINVNPATSSSCGPGHTFGFTPVPEQTYLVAVSGSGGDMGPVVLHWPGSLGYVDAAPYGLTNPSHQSVATGGTATFTAAAGGRPAPTVQWERATEPAGYFWPIAGETSTTLNVPSVDATMNGYRYRAVFTNALGTHATASATLTVLYAPTVSTDPSSQTVAALTTVSLTAAAGGNPAPSVQWERSTDGGTTFVPISGAISATYSFTAATSMNGYRYRAVFTNSQGSATSAVAILGVTASQATVTGLSATFSKGKITVTFTGVGDPAPTMYECRMEVRGAVWVSCTSGAVIKSSAKSVSVHASNDGGTTWGPFATATVTKR